MGTVNLKYRDCKLMEMHYPLGSQYADLIGNGALVGFADEVLKATAQFRAK